MSSTSLLLLVLNRSWGPKNAVILLCLWNQFINIKSTVFFILLSTTKPPYIKLEGIYSPHKMLQCVFSTAGAGKQPYGKILPLCEASLAQNMSSLSNRKYISSLHLSTTFTKCEHWRHKWQTSIDSLVLNPKELKVT